jgi:heme oxygenase-like protein
MDHFESVAIAMRDFIDRWRDVAILEASHETRTVAGKPVAWWFNTANATTEGFMRALASDTQLIVPGRPGDSRFFTTFLKPSRRMGVRLTSDRQIVESWISANAPIPTGEPVSSSSTMNAPPARRTVPYFEGTSATELQANEPEYFHQLINIETYPDFLPDAKRLAEHYLAVGAKQSVKGWEYEPLEDFLEYDEAELEARMQAIYQAFVASMYMPDWFDSGLLWFQDEGGTFRLYNLGRVSDNVPRERMFHVAPFNLVDGAWLQNIITVGPSNKIQSNLFSIWSDEAGNGAVSQNHPNVFDALLRSQNIYLPPITSREFIEQDFLPGAFASAVFQLSVGNFPEAFFPELLGMTLYLEWEATPTLTPTVRMFKRRAINPLFYRLHVAIDNISEGHGALAMESVKLYLQQKREEGGDKAVQQHWLRIRNGYITWATIGGLGAQLIERYLVIERKQLNISADSSKKVCWPDFKDYYRRQMIRLIERKAPYARDVHRASSIGGQSLSDLFENPQALLDALVQSRYVDPERPRDSRFLHLMEFNGPMYKVFTERDKGVVLDWIESLRTTSHPCIDPVPDGPIPDVPQQMADLIADRAVDAMSAHAGVMVTGADGRPTPLASLFEKPATVMQTLISNGWVVPGDDTRSMFFTRIINNGGPMDGVFNDTEKEVVRAWIVSGAELPREAATDGQAVLATNDTRASRLAVKGLVRRRHLLGMGGVH